MRTFLIQRLSIIKQILLGNFAPYKILLLNPLLTLFSIIKGSKDSRLSYYNKNLKTVVYFLKKQGYNVCINDRIKKDYDPDKKNILIAVESPEYVKYLNWIDVDMEFVAEISYGNFYNLKNFYPARDLHISFDGFVELELNKVYNKNKLISMIYSKTKNLTGHKLRHEVSNKLGHKIDMFGYGYTGVYLKDKRETLDEYMFHVTIENCKNPFYSSEKIYDCFKTKCIPIYWGGEENLVELGFDINGIIIFDTIDNLDTILKNLDEKKYKLMKKYATFNYEKLIELRTNFTMKTLYGALSMGGYYMTTGSMYNGEHNNLSIGINK